MSNRYNTIQQHEPLRAPSGWSAEERRLLAQLEEIFDDLYRRFNRLRLEDLGKTLRETIVSTSDDVKTLSTKIEQNASQIVLTAQVVNNILGGDVPVSAVESSTVAISASGVHIKTGGVFTVDSGNFDLDEKGNVDIRNATITGTLSGGVSGNLSSGGDTALTGRDVIVSTNEPTGAKPGALWVRPLANTTLTYKLTNADARRFENFTDGVVLTCQSAPAEASSGGSYRLVIPYRCLFEDATSGCVASVSLSNGASSIAFDVALERGAGAFVVDEVFSDAAWLGNADTIALNVALSGGQASYDRYFVDPGSVRLLCTSATEDGALGWNSAEIRIYQ